jgi:hypothetical protein
MKFPRSSDARQQLAREQPATKAYRAHDVSSGERGLHRRDFVCHPSVHPLVEVLPNTARPLHFQLAMSHPHENFDAPNPEIGTDTLLAH